MNGKKRIFAALSALLFSLAVLSGCGAAAIPLNDYVSVRFSGENGDGRARATLDMDALLEDYAEVLKIDKENEPIEAFAIYGDFHTRIDGGLDRESGLSNGDKVKFVWNEIDAGRFGEKYSVDLQFSDIEFTVSGLE